MSAVDEAVRAETDPAAPTPPDPARRPWVLRPAYLVAAVVAAWVVGSVLMGGVQTLASPRSELTGLHESFNDLRDWFESQRGAGALGVLDAISDGVGAVVTFTQQLVSVEAFPRPVPEIGWLGVVALGAWLGLLVAGWRWAAISAAALLSFGYLGYWVDSLDLLVVTALAVVAVTVVGVPLGAWMAVSPVLTRLLTPVLDVLQTLPSFVYLLPITLAFGIGAAPAVIVTALYAFAPVVRISAHGIASVSPTSLEAAQSMGATGWQQMLKVRLPMARRTIVVGINQSIMAALSMATIAAFISSPGLGVPVITALQSLDVGGAFVAGLAIVVMAVWLDRMTTVAGERSTATRTPAGTRRRRLVLAAGLVAAVVAVWVSRTYLVLAEFPESSIGDRLADTVNDASEGFTRTFASATNVVADAFSYGLLNPWEHVVAESPWWWTALALVALSFLLAGVRSAVVTVVALAVVLGTGVWYDAMVTLATTTVATAVVMVIGLVLGVAMAHSARIDLLLRPLLDAGQVIPPFVYLIPVVGLFGVTRFAAIVAAIVYGVPVAAKLVCDAVRGVAPTTVEAARSVGVSRWQLITRVQLPMARPGIALAANQGLLYVFAVVVIGGLVGAGGLGYLVVAGFSRGELYGKGLAAGIAIVALAIMLDRMLQGGSRARTAP